MTLTPAPPVVRRPRPPAACPECVQRNARRSDARAAVRLTPRQLEVLTLMAQGLTSREIGQRLYLTELTIKGYTERVLARLGARSRSDAVARALRAGVIE